MKKVEIRISDDQTGEVQIYDVSTVLQPPVMSLWDSYAYHTLCARSTLFPGKTIEEVQKIIEDNLAFMQRGFNA